MAVVEASVGDSSRQGPDMIKGLLKVGGYLPIYALTVTH